MKNFALVFVCLFTLPFTSFAQTPETFDLATFHPPVGWKKEMKDGVLILGNSDRAKGTYAMIMLYRSGNSSGNAQSDFEADWQEFIVQQLEIKSQPEIEPPKTEDGWKIITGVAAVKNELGTSALILKTYSGYGKKFSAAAMFNSQDYLPAIEAFALSVKLSKPEAQPNQSPASTDSDLSILGTWLMTQSDQSAFSVKNAVSGYVQKQYTFHADGTYTFLAKAFAPTMQNILLGRESGTYQVSGNTLTIIPKTSVSEAWSKDRGIDAWGTRLNSQPRPIEKVTYQFTKHYFSGIQKWNLVLQASKPTFRDGPYNGGTVFDNAWLYGPPCDQCYIRPPR